MRKPTWTWYHTEQELHHAYRHAPHPQATRRLYALSLLRRGCTPTQVAHLMGVSRATLYRWYHWYATEGVVCLQTRTHGGARRQATSLTPAPQVALRDYTAPHGFRTQAEAQAWVQQQFGVALPPEQVRGWFRRLGLRRKVPRPRAVRADAEA